MNILSIEPLAPSQVSATDQVFDALYQAIVSVKLPPGTKVSEAEIAKQLDVSRQPVRDAFFRLSNLGFLAIRPQRATLITQISETAITNAMFTRIALEVECLRVAMRDHKEQLADRLCENLKKQRGALKSDPSEFHALDEEFHEIICTVAGHAHVWMMIREKKAHLDRIRFLTLSQERQSVVIEEHASLLEAISSGEIDRAEVGLREHIAGVTSVIAQVKERHPNYFETP